MVETTAEVVISNPIIESRIPEKNALEALEGLFYRVGAITRPSRHHGFERPLSLRAQRANILRKMFPKTGVETPEERQNLRAEANEAKARDEIMKQYLTQKEIRVMVDGAGEQMSRFITLEPLTDKERETPPIPIVIVPGASNDIDCVGTLAQELALRGRKVIVLGYPESFMGKVTPEFVEMIEKSSTYQPHAEFYKKAINGILPGGDFELWGYSNGGPIAEQMLNDKNFWQRVKDAVIIAPSNNVNQTMGEFMVGAAKELKHIMEEFKLFPRYSYTTGNKNLEDKGHLELRSKVLGILIKKIRTEMDLWKGARVKEGGKILIVSGERDEITKSSRTFNKKTEPDLMQENPQLRVLEVPDSHAGILIEPIPILNKIQEIQAVSL